MTATPLPLLVEVRRMYLRPACYVVICVVAAFPLLPLLLTYVGSTQAVIGARDVTATAGASGLSFATFALLLMGQLVTPTVAAYFFGESIARDAEWGSLHGLIVSGAGRGRLLQTKVVCAGAATCLAVMLCATISLAIGLIWYGAGPLAVPGNTSIEFAAGAGRLALMVVTMIACNAWIAALALLLSTWSRGNALTAVGVPLMVLLTSHLLGTFPGLGYARDFLPTRSYDTWMVWAYSPVRTDILAWGVFVSLLYALVFGIAALVTFQARDISH